MDVKAVIVIVVGGFHHPHSWDAVANSLRGKGFTVLVPPLACVADATEELDSSATYVDDVENIHKELLPLLDEGREAVLVSHSYGAISATAATVGQTAEERKTRGLKGGVRSIIHVAAMVHIEKGKSSWGLTEVVIPDWHKDHGNGVIELLPPGKGYFYSDMEPAAIEEAWSNLARFQTKASWAAIPETIESELAIPQAYVLTENDICVPTAVQEAWVQAMRFEQVVRLPSAHSPHLTMPERLAEVIEDLSSM